MTDSAPATNTLIQVQNLYKLFGAQATKHMALVHEGRSKDEILSQTGHTLGLRDISLDIKQGELFVIMGLSGSGKSTLIRHFNRLIDPTEGSLSIDGTDIMQLRPKALQAFRQKKMSMVFQRFALLPHYSVIENIAYGLKVQNIPKKERLDKAREWAQAVGLKGYEELYPGQLSGGQQQRVGLARALCTDAEILLMDEAFSALDPLIRSEMQDQLIHLQEKLHKTIIFITHDLDEALRLGDRIAILKDGSLEQVGTPAEILLNPQSDYVDAFVQDVNRARALTVETVMKPAAYRVSAETIAGALAQMKKLPSDYGYYITDDGYQGVVTQETLEQAANHSADNKVCEKVIEDVPHCAPEDSIETVLAGTLDHAYPLPVVDDDGNIQGRLSKEKLAKILAESSAS